MRTNPGKRNPWVASATTTMGVLLLASGTCEVSYCSEDCDPCVTQCHCSNLVCHHGAATAFRETHRLASFELLERRDPSPGRAASGSIVRTFADIYGLSVQRAGGPAIPSAPDLVAFARGVLEVNAALFAREDRRAGWILDSVDLYESAGVVTFHREYTSASDGARFLPTNCVSFLFDPHGSLIEIDQTLGA